MAGASPDPKELIAQAWTKISRFLSLEPNEKEYLSAVEMGEVKMDLLIPNDIDDAGFIAKHPAILWKIHNVRKHIKQQKQQRTQNER